MSVRRDSTGESAAALDALFAAGAAAFAAGTRLTDAQRSDATFMIGWRQAAERGSEALVALRARVDALDLAARDAKGMVAHVALIREALEAAIPAWNLCKPARPNPRQAQQMAAAIAKTEAALAALARITAAVPPAPARSPKSRSGRKPRKAKAG